MKNILIFGANSAIANACARLWSERGDRLLLVARDEVRLRENAADLAVRGDAARVHTFLMDARETARIPALLDFARATLKTVDIVLIAHGTLPDQAGCEASLEATLEAVEINGVATVALLAAFAALLRQEGRGTLAVIGSPAGDRGRASNYTYGAAKSLVHSFAEGLHHRLWREGIAVVTVKPGFIDTPMTAGFDRRGPLWTTPQRVARDIVRGIDAQRAVVYAPWYWRWIMLAIVHLPRWLMVRTRL